MLCFSFSHCLLLQVCLGQQRQLSPTRPQNGLVHVDWNCGRSRHIKPTEQVSSDTEQGSPERAQDFKCMWRTTLPYMGCRCVAAKLPVQSGWDQSRTVHMAFSPCTGHRPERRRESGSDKGSTPMLGCMYTGSPRYFLHKTSPRTRLIRSHCSIYIFTCVTALLHMVPKRVQQSHALYRKVHRFLAVIFRPGQVATLSTQALPGQDLHGCRGQVARRHFHRGAVI